MTTNLGIANAQNISPFSYPFNITDIPNLYNLNIPEKLPEVVISDEEEDGEVDRNIIVISKNKIIDRDWVSNILLQLERLVQQMPKYQLPPLINVDTSINKNLKTYLDEIVNDNFGNDFVLNQQQQQQQH